MVEVRRYLHQHPELSFQEVKTPKYIAEYHERLGHEVRTGVGGGGVVATLRGGKPGKTVALRADFDALPIQEETDVPFKSVVDGVMHACGHDSHTATLLGVNRSRGRIECDSQFQKSCAKKCRFDAHHDGTDSRSDVHRHQFAGLCIRNRTKPEGNGGIANRVRCVRQGSDLLLHPGRYGFNLVPRCQYGVCCLSTACLYAGKGQIHA